MQNLTDEVAFSPDELAGEAIQAKDAWNILLVDDEPEIHNVTKLALKGFLFDRRPLKFVHAYSAAQARAILKDDSTIAVIFLDVVMETGDAGFDVIKFVRDEIKNQLVSIVLRTGQPGHAPERDVIEKYAINDYKSKSELTAQKLYVSVVASLRTYQNLVQLQRSNERLEFEVAERTEELNDKNIQLVELVAQRTEQQNLAESANLAKSRFLAAASHDLRQPMHALNLYLSALADYDLPHPARPLLSNVNRCAQTLDEMFDALLNISRLDASVIHPNLSVFPVAMLLDRIRMEFMPQARAKGLELRVAHCSALLRSDSNMAERILRNLVSNALRYTERGKILVGCRRQGERLAVAVYDTGPGIAPAEQRLVFEEFYQVGNAERDRAQGLGLGLSIVLRKARLLETQVTLVSELGRGSMFSVDFPCAQYEKTLPELHNLPAEISYGKLADALIVVIDDEAGILNATRAVLEQWGCRVITAASGAEAIEQLAVSTRVPDALICDFRLRGEENGIQVIDTIRQEFNLDIPGLLTTGDTAPDRIHKIQASGLAVLYKPIQGSILKDVLARLILSTASSPLSDDD